MPIPQEVLDLENRSTGVNGEPTLASAYAILKRLWDVGERDRELGLHLMFLAWYGIIEPPESTGFWETDEAELRKVLNEVHAYYEPVIRQDAEMLYAFGLAAEMFWYMFEDEKAWEQRAAEYHRLYRALEPNGIDPCVFQNRGAYGEYYAGHAKHEGGY